MTRHDNKGSTPLPNHFTFTPRILFQNFKSLEECSRVVDPFYTSWHSDKAKGANGHPAPNIKV